MNKKWSALNEDFKSKSLKRGHFAEYFAEMQLTLYGFEVYKTLIDDRGIDFIIRNPNGAFFEIQVKSIIDYNNIKITRDKFDTSNDHLYLVAIKFVDDKDPEIYIIPSTKWTNPDNIFYDSGIENKEPQYGLRLTTEKNCEYLKEYKFENYIEKIMVIKH